MHRLQWCLKTIGQIPQGSRKPGQIPCNIQDPDPANIYIYMPRSLELSKSALVHHVVVLLLYLLRELNRNMDQGLREDGRKCLDLYPDRFSGEFFPSMTFQTPGTKALQYTLPKSHM